MSHGRSSGFSLSPHRCLLMHTEIAVLTNEPQTLSGSVCRAMHFYGIGVFLISFLISFVAILVRNVVLAC